MATVSEFMSAATPAVSVPGWTWSATMGLIQNLLLAGGGSGLAALIIKAQVQLKRIANERAKQDGDRDGARWSELMDLNDRLQQRIEKLENDVRDERRRSDDEVAAMRKSHAEEMTALRDAHSHEIRGFNERIDQLQRTIFAGQQAVAQVIPATYAPKTTESLKRQLDRLNDTPGASE